MTMDEADILDEIAILEKFVASRSRPVDLPFKPNARQAEFLALDCREALYGGAAGGGKSIALLLAALQYVHVPGYNAILFRRTFPQLEGPGGLIDKSHQLLDGVPGAKWRASSFSWVFESGATLTFAHMDREESKINYQGLEAQFIGFDELTHFTETQYTYLFSRCRRPKDVAGTELASVPLRVRAATNPGGQGHRWVVKRFGLRVDGSQEKSWTQIVDGEPPVTLTPQDRPFIPAKLEDNAEHLDIETYEENLKQLDKNTRDQLRKGRWVADGQGLVYGSFDRTRNCLTRFEDDGTWSYVLAIDLGTSESKKTTAFVILAYSHHTKDRVVVVRSWSEAGMTPHSTAERIAFAMEAYDLEHVVVDAGGLGGGYLKDFQVRFGEACEAARKSDKFGARRFINGAFERGDLWIVFNEGDDENKDLVEQLETVPWDERGMDVAKNVDDHFTDALLYGHRACRAYAAEDRVDKPAPGTKEYFDAQEKAMLERWDAERTRDMDEPWSERL